MIFPAKKISTFDGMPQPAMFDDTCWRVGTKTPEKIPLEYHETSMFDGKNMSKRHNKPLANVYI